MTINGYEVSSGVMKMFQNPIVVMVVQLCEYTKAHQIVCFKRVTLQCVNYISTKIKNKKESTMHPLLFVLSRSSQDFDAGDSSSLFSGCHMLFSFLYYSQLNMWKSNLPAFLISGISSILTKEDYDRSLLSFWMPLGTLNQ